MESLHPALYWLIIGIALFLLELALPGFILFFFALGALATALIAYLLPIGLAWQLSFFIVASLVALFSLRGVLRRRFFTSIPEQHQDQALVMSGERGVVSIAIVPPAEGRVKCSGSTWRATADERIEVGEIVTVICRRELVIHVERV